MKRTQRNHYIITLSILTIALVGQPAWAIKAKSKQSSQSVKNSTVSQSSVQDSAKPLVKGANILWDEWYTVMIAGKVHYGFYNERVELRDGGNQVFLKNEFWKQEEDYINREDLGVVSNSATLSPMFFNFHSIYRTTETIIDGNVKDGKFLSVRIKRGGQDLPIVQRSIPSKVFFSALFPYWLGKQLPSMKEGDVKNFETVMEDNIELGFSPMEGQIKIEKADETARAGGLKKVRVDSRGIRSWWWVTNEGMAERIEMPEQKIVVTRSKKEIAKKFLNGTI
jgi:hypothetical protein